MRYKYGLVYQSKVRGQMSSNIAGSHFNNIIQNKISRTTNHKVAFLVTNEYEGIYRNGGIGTHYKNLAVNLSKAGWYIIVLICNSSSNFNGNSPFPEVGLLFSTGELANILEVDDAQKSILREVHADSLDIQSFSCLFYTEAVLNYFNDSKIYVEFHEMMGIGYRTIQAKESGAIRGNFVVGVTLHSNSEWLVEVNEKFYELPLADFWQRCYYEEYSFENADLSFFPSFSLKNTVASYKWNTDNAIHLPYFVPIVEIHKELLKKQKISSGINQHKLTIIFFGRLEERKGLCTFVEALNRIDVTLQESIQVIFMGKVIPLQSFTLYSMNSSSYIKRALSKIIQYSILSDLSSSEAINFIAALNSPIVCLTSHQENFPNTSLEMGQLPVRLVVSDIGGFRETLTLINRSDEVYWFESANSSSLAQEIKEAVTSQTKEISIPKREEILSLNSKLLHKRLEYIETKYKELKSENEHILNQNPKVTIGITCFNLGQYLLECLESVRNQTYANLEVLVLDDASTDEFTCNIFSNASSTYSNFEFIKLNENVGLGNARNLLVERATGDFFIPLDADNFMLPNAVEKFVIALFLSKANVVSCKQQKYGYDSLNFTGAYLPLLMITNITGDAFSIFRTEILKNIIHSKNRSVLTHDWQIFSALVATDIKIAYYPYPLYYYRVRHNSMIRSALPKQQRYYLFKYISQLGSSQFSERQLYVLLAVMQQLISLSEEKNFFGFPIPIFSWTERSFFFETLRKLYLKISGGGLSNPSPNFFSKFIIFIKQQFF